MSAVVEEQVGRGVVLVIGIKVLENLDIVIINVLPF